MASQGVDDLTEKLSRTSVDSSSLLSFKGRGLKLDKAENAKLIVQEIEKCSCMKALQMEGNTLGVEAAEEIAKAIGKHPEFERALWSDMFTGRLKTEVPHSLKHLSKAIMQAGCHLVEIDLSDNAFGPNGIVGLVDLLKSKSCHSLKELKLNNNGLGISGGKTLAQCLIECHSSSVTAGKPLTLRVFISGRNRLENEGSKALAAAFKKIGTLEHVAMPQNGINHEGISALADAFACNPGLKHLNLNDNTFTVKGAEAIVKSLPKLQALEIINFGDCLIKTKGVIGIAKALQNSHHQLKELDLSGNEIKKEGAIALVESLEGKESFAKIDLDGNMLGVEGCGEVRDVLEAAGLLDTLATLSCDEGSEDENEEDSEGNEEEEEPEDDEDGEISTDPHLQVTGSALTPSKQCISLKEFLAFPSPTKLLQLGSSDGDALLQELGDDKNDIEKVIAVLFKVTLVCSDDETTKKACNFADQVLPSLFYSVENAGSIIANAFLVCMGLIKGENKKQRLPANVTGPLLVLEHVVKQPYFTSLSREILLYFLSKPHPILEHSSTARHKILDTLYSF